MAFHVAVIGAGNVGAAVTYAITLRNLASKVSLIDINEHKEEGEVMDIADGICFVETGCVRRGDFEDARTADVVVITAGAPQKEGESRLDLLEKNKTIMKAICKSIGTLKKETIVVVVTNPVDIMTQYVQTLLKLPRHRVFGTGTALDTARLRTAIGQELGVSAKNVTGFVVGEHGDSECVAWSSVHVAGIPVEGIKQLNSKKQKRIEQEVAMEAYEIIKRKGATYFGIATTTAEIVEAIVHDQKVILPVSTYVETWNGVSNICMGVPAVIGKDGIEKVWPLLLNRTEKARVMLSSKAIKKGLQAL